MFPKAVIILPPSEGVRVLTFDFVDSQWFPVICIDSFGDFQSWIVSNGEGEFTVLDVLPEVKLKSASLTGLLVGSCFAPKVAKSGLPFKSIMFSRPIHAME